MTIVSENYVRTNGMTRLEVLELLSDLISRASLPEQDYELDYAALEERLRGLVKREKEISETPIERDGVHTRGPLRCVEDESLDSPYSRYITSALFEEMAYMRGPLHFSVQKENARLLAAAYNSYDRNCGTNAIAAAEEDLLGELLDASKKAFKEIECFVISDSGEHGEMPGLVSAYKQLQAALCKAQNPKH